MSQSRSNVSDSISVKDFFQGIFSRVLWSNRMKATGLAGKEVTEMKSRKSLIVLSAILGALG